MKETKILDTLTVATRAAVIAEVEAMIKERDKVAKKTAAEIEIDDIVKKL